MSETKRDTRRDAPAFLPEPLAARWTEIKYLLVGGYNTAFGFLVFSALYLWIGDSIHYLLIAVAAYVISITNAFLLHRYLVFHSRGNILAEYFKTYVVYGASTVIGLVLMALLVELAQIHPIIAQLAVVVVTVLFSYVGHSRFTFNQRD